MYWWIRGSEKPFHLKSLALLDLTVFQTSLSWCTFSEQTPSGILFYLHYRYTLLHTVNLVGRIQNLEVGLSQHENLKDARSADLGCGTLQDLNIFSGQRIRMCDSLSTQIYIDQAPKTSQVTRWSLSQFISMKPINHAYNCFFHYNSS